MSVVQAEASAILFGMKYARDAGFRTMIIETDCLGLISLLQGRTTEKSATQVIINDIAVVKSSLDECSFNYVNRSCNKAAHAMAKTSLSFEEVLVLLEECPPMSFQLSLRINN